MYKKAGAGLAACKQVAIASRLSVGLVALISLQGYLSGSCLAQSIDLRYESSQKASERNMTTPGNTFGDSVSLENGTLVFDVVDISIPGNNSLPVEFRRSFNASGYRQENHNPRLAEWRVALPRIEGSYAAEAGWLTSDPNRPTKNCTVASQSYIAPPPVAVRPHLFPVFVFWSPPRLSFPGGSSRMLVYNTGTLPAPSMGGPFYWTTADSDYVACIPTLKNAGGVSQEERRYGQSEGYLVTRPDGTRYWFDWVAVDDKDSLITYDYFVGYPDGSVANVVQEQVTLSLYPTRVEDRFGNWVTYTYSNKSNEYVKLDRVESSDGRVIDVVHTEGHITSVSSHGRTWTYGYGVSYSSLIDVGNPDGSHWRYSGSPGNPISITLTGPYDGSCDSEAWIQNHNSNAAAGDWINGVRSGTYTVEAPSGGRADFVLGMILLGRSGVPKDCYISGYVELGGHGGPIDRLREQATPLAGYAKVLLSKKVAGPGLSEATWAYTYQSLIGWLPFTDGGTQTKVMNPDGSLDIYKYGNTYQKDEGLLLSVTHTKSGASLQTTTKGYDLTPRPVGFHPSVSRGYPDVYLRPLKLSSTTQQSMSFTWQVPSTCGANGVSICFDDRARPTKVVKSSVPAP